MDVLNEYHYCCTEVTICGEDCTQWAEWVTASKITCLSGREVGWGEVIVTTKSGGRGTCTVHFRGLPPPVGGELKIDSF